MKARINTSKQRHLSVIFVVDNLQYIWTKLDFHVEKFYNLSETEIMRTLAHYAFKVDHTQFDCFVCCVLTHGRLFHVVK